MIWYGNLHPGHRDDRRQAHPRLGQGRGQLLARPRPARARRARSPSWTPRPARTRRPSPGAISRGNHFRDPWAFSENCFLAARRADARRAWTAPARSRRSSGCPRPTVEAGLHLHEPRPLVPRPRERIIPDRVKPGAATGRLVLADIYDGRNMAGVKRGEIKKLLVLETLPMPIHYTGGMDPISYGGTFTLERIVGTVPVEADGSAYLELPALRSFFFVALDENDLSVKRMQSFLTVQPGETTSCVGCHEQRTQTPRPAATHARRPAPPAQPHRADRRMCPRSSISRATSSRSSTRSA